MKNRRLFSPLLFSFLSKQIHKYEKVVEKSSRLYNVYSKLKWGCAGRTVDFGFRSYKLIRIFFFELKTNATTFWVKITFSKQIF